METMQIDNQDFSEGSLAGIDDLAGLFMTRVMPGLSSSQRSCLLKEDLKDERFEDVKATQEAWLNMHIDLRFYLNNNLNNFVTVYKKKYYL